ncbi:unnamed protein product [Oppiella nova]|uniref:Uncharacterized protein n=1 Tax=Oppiella nova TaxID=334625 RepID=A0A7R9MIF2_9ACAR|nr:unnamed protein product [Oppiella nova]CAG2177691.1 unnamed protein product [Oppiella nova]
MATKSLFKKSKKTKPKIIDLTENEDNNRSAEDLENRPLISANEFNNDETSRETIVNMNPSAPPEEEYRPTGLADDKTRRLFVQKVYAILCAQKTLFCILIALFTYIPHLRKIFRKWIFDPMFYTSIIGVPLCLFFGLLTTSLSLLISYAITQSTAKAFLYSMGFSNICDIGVILGSKSRLDFTKWRYISLIPLTMIVSSVFAPTLLHTSLNNTIWPSIIMTSASTYLAGNTVPVIRHNDLRLEPNEYVFAVSI